MWTVESDARSIWPLCTNFLYLHYNFSLFQASSSIVDSSTLPTILPERVTNFNTKPVVVPGQSTKYMPLEEQLQLARQQYEEALDPNQLPEERNLLEFRIKYIEGLIKDSSCKPTKRDEIVRKGKEKIMNYINRNNQENQATVVKVIPPNNNRQNKKPRISVPITVSTLMQ